MREYLEKIRLLEWGILSVTFACQVLWTIHNSSWDTLYLCSFIGLGLGAAGAYWIPADDDRAPKYWIYGLQLLCYFIAMSCGTFRLYAIAFVMLALKIALIPDVRVMVLSNIGLFVMHSIGFLIAQHFFQSQAHAIHPERHAFTMVNFIENRFIMAASFVAIVLFARAAMAERISRKQVDRLNKEVDTMAVEVERGRIARDIHDGVGHNLTSLNIQLELTAKLLEDSKRADEARESLATSRKIANAALTDLRRALKIIQDDDINLHDAIASITQDIQKQGRLNFEVHVDDAALSTAARHSLLMIVKECLNNIQKHAAASKVQINLAAQAGKAKLSVSDNGHGFSTTESSEGLGIKGMHERVLSLGGTINITSQPGQGTKVLVSLPT
ncbi:MAG TPA: sensor histidine kinase [Oculatellaceae cyanobacterium]